MATSSRCRNRCAVASAAIFGNMADAWTAVNNMLEGNGHDAGSDINRVAVNSTVGLLGCFDVASGMGLDKHQEGFRHHPRHLGLRSWLLHGPAAARTRADVRDGAGLIGRLRDRSGRLSVSGLAAQYHHRRAHRRSALPAAGCRQSARRRCPRQVCVRARRLVSPAGAARSTTAIRRTSRTILRSQSDAGHHKSRRQLRPRCRKRRLNLRSIAAK